MIKSISKIVQFNAFNHYVFNYMIVFELPLILVFIYLKGCRE